MMLYSAYPYWEEQCDMTILSTGPEIGPYAKELEQRGYKIAYLPIQKGAAIGQESKKSKLLHLVRFYRFLRAGSYDVIHVHKESLSENYIQLAVRAGVPFCVRTVHNNFRFEGKLGQQKSKSRSRCQKTYGAAFIAISDGVMENEKETFGITCDKKIYNWCNNEKYGYIGEEQKQQYKADAGMADRCVLISTGNCSNVKNHELLLRAIAGMKEKDAVYYYHIGYGKQVTEAEETLAEELGISGQIRFVGFSDPLRYLEQADIFVMPSLYEGLSIAAIEAATCGMNLLLADTPGVTEFMDKDFPNVTYFHLNAKDAAGKENILELSDALDRLVSAWKQGKLANTKEQSEKAKMLYSAEVGAEQYLQVYRKGLDR
jgi:glycosyltransferase involved in cell wall biosynthesis